MKEVLQSIYNASPKAISRLCETLKNILYILGELVGCRISKDGSLNCDRIIMAGFIFIIGVPIGMLFFGEMFTAPLWGTVVLVILAAANMDTALSKMAENRQQNKGALEYEWT